MKNPINAVVHEIEQARYFLDQRGLLSKLRDDDLIVMAGHDAYGAIMRDADASIRATLVRNEPLKIYGVAVKVSGDFADDEIAVCQVLRRAQVTP